jgi:hypothetical protein
VRQIRATARKGMQSTPRRQSTVSNEQLGKLWISQECEIQEIESPRWRRKRANKDGGVAEKRARLELGHDFAICNKSSLEVIVSRA